MEPTTSSKSEEEFVNVGGEFKKKAENNLYQVASEDAFKDVLNSALPTGTRPVTYTANKRIARMPTLMAAQSGPFRKSTNEKVTPARDLPLPHYPWSLTDTMTSVSGTPIEATRSVSLHSARPAVDVAASSARSETDSDKLFNVSSLPPESAWNSMNTAEDSFWLNNEDLCEEDRNKAIAWASAAAGVEHIGFVPECVLRSGFKIKKFLLWIPIEICVDYHNKRLTIICADNFTDLFLRKMIAHRVDIGDIRSEMPLSHKVTNATAASNSQSAGERPINCSGSRRRVNLVRSDGRGKYRLLAPTSEYRDKFLNIVFMMSRSSTPSASASASIKTAL